MRLGDWFVVRIRNADARAGASLTVRPEGVVFGKADRGGRECVTWAVKLAPGASPEMTAATVHELSLGQHGVAAAACARDGKGAAPSSSCAVIVAFTSAGGS